MDGARQHLLPRTALAVDRHRGLPRRRDARGELQHLLHGGVHGDDALEGVPVGEQPLDLLVFADDMLVIDGALDGDAQVVRLVGFFQIVVGAAPHRLHGALDAAVGRDDDDGGGRFALLHLLDQGEAVHPRHDQVGEDQVDRLLLQHLQRLQSVDRGMDGVADFAKLLFQEETEDRLIVDGKDFGGVRHGIWLRKSGFTVLSAAARGA